MMQESRKMLVEEDEQLKGKGEERLFAAEELVPITQSLITPELAHAFGIAHRLLDHEAASDLQPVQLACAGDRCSPELNGNSPLIEERESHYTGAKECARDEMNADVGEEISTKPARGKLRMGSAMIEEEDACCSAGDEPSPRTLKRPRLVWTPQLHKRFVEAVSQLGINNAVPKTIMHLMNVDGLTRENVASHLQKYRLYLKRIPSDGPSASAYLNRHAHGLHILPLQLSSLSHHHLLHRHLVAPAVAPPLSSGFHSRVHNAIAGSPQVHGHQVLGWTKGGPRSPSTPILTLFPH